MYRVDCDHVERLIHLRLDGESSEDEARLLDEHLDQCAECRRIQQDLARVDAALREGLGSLRLPEPPYERVRQSVRRARGGRTLLATWLPAAAAFILVASALLIGLQRTRGPQPLGAPAVVVAGADAVHVFEPDQRTAQSGQIGTRLQEHAVAWGLGGEPIALEFEGGAQVELNDEAVVRIGRDAIDLFKGDLRADLTGARETFTVVTPWGRFSGSGAVFTVYSNNDGSSSRLTVLSGEVSVTRGRSVWTLGDGQTIRLQPDTEQPMQAIVL